MKSYEVTGRVLTHNGKSHAPGASISLHEADGAVFVRLGRLREKAPRKARTVRKAKAAKGE